MPQFDQDFTFFAGTDFTIQVQVAGEDMGSWGLAFKMKTPTGMVTKTTGGSGITVSPADTANIAFNAADTASWSEDVLECQLQRTDSGNADVLMDGKGTVAVKL